jgi:UDP-glucose 4-epimerase
MVPTRLGFDPRLQFIHEDDAVAALSHAVFHPVSGTFNIASRGQMYLSRVLRLGGRIQQPLPKRGFEAALRALARLDLYVPDHISGLLRHGRVLDTTAMGSRLGFEPSKSCRQSVLAAYGRLPEIVDPR